MFNRAIIQVLYYQVNLNVYSRNIKRKLDRKIPNWRLEKLYNVLTFSWRGCSRVWWGKSEARLRCHCFKDVISNKRKRSNETAWFHVNFFFRQRACSEADSPLLRGLIRPVWPKMRSAWNIIGISSEHWLTQKPDALAEVVDRFRKPLCTLKRRLFWPLLLEANRRRKVTP